jgi:hypothetical protein
VCLGGWRGEVVLNKNNDFYAVYFVKKLIIMLFFLALNLALLLKLANNVKDKTYTLNIIQGHTKNI